MITIQFAKCKKIKFSISRQLKHTDNFAEKETCVRSSSALSNSSFYINHKDYKTWPPDITGTVQTCNSKNFHTAPENK